MRAVLFDFGGVITEPLGSVLGALARTAGADPAEFAVLLLGDYDAPDHPWNRLERGETTFAELCDWARAEGALRGWSLDLAPALDHLAALPFRPAVLDRAVELRARGLRTAVVTNSFTEVTALWRARIDIDALFDTVVDSCEVGVRKPDPGIYRLALERLGGIDPGDAVLLDDFEVNVAGARAMGLHTILVGADAGAALDELERLLEEDEDLSPTAAG
ncbi:MAG TPA: HAD family phosphatase [Acidimicrobiia bacterium]